MFHVQNENGKLLTLNVEENMVTIEEQIDKKGHWTTDNLMQS